MGKSRGAGKGAAFPSGVSPVVWFSQLTREALIKSLSAFILGFLCNARNGKGNSELFKESHDEAVHKNPYKSRFYE